MNGTPVSVRCVHRFRHLWHRRPPPSVTNRGTRAASPTFNLPEVGGHLLELRAGGLLVLELHLEVAYGRVLKRGTAQKQLTSLTAHLERAQLTLQSAIEQELLANDSLEGRGVPGSHRVAGWVHYGCKFGAICGDVAGVR